MLADSWRLAVGTLTAVPVRPPTTVDRRRAALAMVLAPLAVLPIGLLVAAVGLAGHGLDLPSLVTALLAIGAAVLGNRAFHLDGLSDTVDGLAASYDRERSLEVMKSGTSGPAGVVATVLVIGLQAAAVASLLSASWRGAVVAGAVVCLSRAALAACCMRGVPSAREDGLGATYTQTVPVFVCRLVWLVTGIVLAALAVWIGLPWWRGAVAALVALAAVIVLIARANRRFGGVTGDVFGASIELALAAMLVALA
ncbi:adenosylcobinamide-GDP ribazoletransferase [Nocardioides currus]|uniref:Adenosylcobinamide-GDP ribazoletransferase n=1 Tax=Nocardioides currus TaxID=2133958 RepID=A0A2R7YV91_9ACTN|nr:adenosylcobinamide-GDP ribazoletransferase [Nocardioides currus]PUA80223.1 adenosylcobinamide-GDP ribazoletransferase [Nocardioides currus]